MNSAPAKRKILFVNGGQFGYSAGHFYYCKYLKDEFDIHYFCFDRGKEKIFLDGIIVHYLPFEGDKIKRNYNFVIRAINLSKGIKPDTLFVVYFGLAFLLGLFASAKVEKIVDIRTGSLAINPWRRKLNNTFIKFQTHFFDRRIILSEGLQEKLKIKTHNTLVLPLGSDVLFNGSHDFFDSFKLIYVGTLDGRRIDETIIGLALFMQDPKNKKLVEKYTIIGFGSESAIKKLRTTIKQSNLENTVFFEGEKKHSDLGRYFSAANIGVAYIPIEDYYQNQPATKLFEYGLSGIYTLATDTAENRKFVTDINGTLCRDSPDAFAKALEKIKEKRSEINSANIRRSLEDYRWDLLVDKKLRTFIRK